MLHSDDLGPNLPSGPGHFLNLLHYHFHSHFHYCWNLNCLHHHLHPSADAPLITFHFLYHLIFMCHSLGNLFHFSFNLLLLLLAFLFNFNFKSIIIIINFVVFLKAIIRYLDFKAIIILIILFPLIINLLKNPFHHLLIIYSIILRLIHLLSFIRSLYNFLKLA